MLFNQVETLGCGEGGSISPIHIPIAHAAFLISSKWTTAVSSLEARKFISKKGDVKRDTELGLLKAPVVNTGKRSIHSQHGMFWVGRDLEYHLIPISAMASSTDTERMLFLLASVWLF